MNQLQHTIALTEQELHIITLFRKLNDNRRERAALTIDDMLKAQRIIEEKFNTPNFDWLSAELKFKITMAHTTTVM